MSIEWRPIPGYVDYEASSDGRVRSVDRVMIKKNPHTLIDCEFSIRGKELRLLKDDKGYFRVSLCRDRVARKTLVHQVVLLAFVGPRPSGFVGCHNNGLKTDNRPDNLRWDTMAGNSKDSIKHGVMPRGETHPTAKFSDETIRAVRNDPCSNKDACEKYKMTFSHVRLVRLMQTRVTA